MIKQVPHITNAAAGICVAPVTKSMYKNTVKPIIHCHVAHGIEMPVKRMDSTVGHQPEEMNLFFLVTGIRESIDKHLVFLYVAGLAFLVDLYKILVYYPSCTYIKMSHFRISHLSFRQSDIFTACKKMVTGIIFFKSC